MGNPVKIVDLARRMIYLSGQKNIKIEFTGLRHGEKLYEELLNVKESTCPTYHEKIMIAKVREYDYEEIKARNSKVNRFELYFRHHGHCCFYEKDRSRVC